MLVSILLIWLTMYRASGAPYTQADLDYIKKELGVLRQSAIKRIQNQSPPKPPDSGTGPPPSAPPPPKVAISNDKLTNGTNSIVDINANSNFSQYLYQADILLTRNQVDQLVKLDSTRSKRQAINVKSSFYKTWPGKVVYYQVHSSVASMKTPIMAAINFYKKNTCLRFVESSTAKDRIQFILGTSCSSNVGMVGGVQKIQLRTECGKLKDTAHELSHAMGLFHEQSRFDRDQYVFIDFSSIQQDQWFNFDLVSQNTSTNYDLPYDYGSVMQYPSDAFAKTKGQMVMLPKDRQAMNTMGGPFISFYDVQIMNKLYSCGGACKTTIACKNGGMQNPNSCSECICPSGFAGKLCGTRPPGCGKVLNGTAKTQTLSITVGTNATKLQDDYTMCYYHIQAPKGKRVQITVKTVAGIDSNYCTYGGIEIKTKQDMRLSGYRVCHPPDAGSTFVSATNLAVVIAYNNYGITQTTLVYSIV